MGTLNEVFPGVEMSIDDVATGLIRMRKHWFSVKVQKSFSPDGKILKILSVVSYLGFPSLSQEIILWRTWCSSGREHGKRARVLFKLKADHDWFAKHIPSLNTSLCKIPHSSTSDKTCFCLNVTVNTIWLESNQRFEEEDSEKSEKSHKLSFQSTKEGRAETKISKSYLILTISLSAGNEKHKKGESKRQKQKSFLIFLYTYIYM